MRRILFPTDFSDNSAYAFQVAFQFAQQSKAGITLVHFYPANEIARKIEVRHQDYRRGIEQLLQEWARKTLGFPPNGIRFLAGPGSPGLQLIAYSSQYDLIVLGGRNYKHSFTRATSSRSSEIILESKCPVLIIPKGAVLKSTFNILVIARETEDETLAKALLSKTRINAQTLDILNFPVDSSFRLWLEALFGSKLMTRQRAIFQQMLDEKMQTTAFDLFILVSHQKNMVQRLMNSESKQAIFKFAVPLLVGHRSYLEAAT